MECPEPLTQMAVLVTSWDGVQYVSAITREEFRTERVVEATFLHERTETQITIDGTVSFTCTGSGLRRLRYRNSITVPDGKVPEFDDPALCFDPLSSRIVSLREAVVGSGETAIEEIGWTAELFNVADLNRDGWVDGSDLGLLYSDWGLDVVRSDLNRDGTVDGRDLGVLLVQWDG